MQRNQSSTSLFTTLLRDRYPCATAELDMSDVKGRVRFFKTPIGTVVAAELYGITSTPRNLDFCIANSKNCSPACLAPLSEDSTCLRCAGITDRYHVEDIMGKTIEIHVGSTDTAAHTIPLTARGKIRWMAEAR